MSSAVVNNAESAATQAPTGKGSLLWAEALRFRSRRMVRVLVALGVLGFLAAVVIASTQYAAPSAAGLADAAHNRQRIFLEQQRSSADCLKQVGTPNGPPTKADCGTPINLDQLGPVNQFLSKRPFTLAAEGRAGVLAVTGATAALAFLIGATFIGAEWSTRSLVALLFWEPRRLRVMTAKLTVTAAAATLLGVAGQAAWLGASAALAATRGTTSIPHGLWPELIGAAGRGVVLVVLVALLGFGIANLVRHTAAALGAGFLYFAVLENAIRALRPRWQSWLYTDNAVALVTTGGTSFHTNEGYVDKTGQYHDTGHDILISNLHGGLLLAAVSALVLAAGVLLFRRRDLN